MSTSGVVFTVNRSAAKSKRSQQQPARRPARSPLPRKHSGQFVIDKNGSMTFMSDSDEDEVDDEKAFSMKKEQKVSLISRLRRVRRYYNLLELSSDSE